MGIQFNGSGTVSGIAVGGLPDGIIQTADMASGVLYQPTGSLRVLEQFLSPCDGSVIPLNQGNTTLDNVTSVQNLTSTNILVSGSEITYEPPAGTVQIIYEFVMHCSGSDAHGIGTVRTYLDSVHTTNAIFSFGANSHFDSRICHRWGFNIGGTQDNASGRRPNWTGGRTIKMMAREYGNSNESRVHATRYTDGGSTSSFVRPCIGITALGTDS